MGGRYKTGHKENSKGLEDRHERTAWKKEKRWMTSATEKQRHTGRHGGQTGKERKEKKEKRYG